MTSKFSIDNRELLQRISSGEAVVGIDFGNLIVRELAAFRLAAMDSRESIEMPLDYLQGHKDGLEWAAQLAEANHPETGDWLYDDPIELAKAIRKGPDMPPVQPAPVVPDDVLKALQKVARIRLDMDGFDGDRRGIADCLCDAEEALIEVVNRRAAMLAAAPQPQNAQQNIPEIIPNELIAAVNRLLDSNGSRGCYNAIKCYDAHIEVERLLAAARQEVKP